MSRRELEEAKRRLLDFSQPLDLELFDDVSRALGSGSPESVSASQEVLMGFREAPEAWTVVDHVIDSNCSVHAKFLAAQVRLCGEKARDLKAHGPAVFFFFCSKGGV